AARFRINGEPLVVAPAFAQQFALVIHELATNAAKYGALSTPGGRVLIAWSLLNHGQLSFSWREHDGPPGTAPATGGFGSKLIEVASMGPSRTTFAPSGLEFSVEVPLWQPKAVRATVS